MNLEQHILSTIYKKKLEKPIKILFPEGDNEKIQAVALKLLKDTFIYIDQDNSLKTIKVKDIIEPVLLLDSKDTISQEADSSIRTIKMVDQTNLAEKLYQIRKDKDLTLEQAQALVQGKNYYGMMLLNEDEVDCLVGGINYKSSDILRPALQIIRPYKKIVTSTFIMHKNDQTYLFADCSINIAPTAEQLVEITDSVIDFALNLDFKTFDPVSFEYLNVAMLSYSTNGSGSGTEVDKVKAATEILKKKDWNSKQKVNIIGEIQFDAAFDEAVRAKKFPELNIKGSCNIFIFPNLESGNIGYKIAQRFGNFQAIGPIILGLNKPVDDLSRGATVEDIYNTVLITCVKRFLKY